MKQISGIEAYARMRLLRPDADSHFTMHHLTWDDTKQTTKGVRTVARARLRPAMPGEKLRRPGDMYLTYIDMDMDEPRTCYRKLVRYVAFPPEFELLKVNWFTK